MLPSATPFGDFLHDDLMGQVIEKSPFDVGVHNKAVAGLVEFENRLQSHMNSCAFGENQKTPDGTKVQRSGSVRLQQ